ncbi:acetylglutamate kinase [Flavobacteriaceae bacterium]|nr:acetylglutamate kinase [Flavobacteriaceae bacterium]MDC3221035.1 acetylglutamate kinase [Flavobacteriaceae bacterium]
MKNKLTIIKVGGGILNERKLFEIFLENYSKIKGLKLLIHGGGVIASSYMIRLGIPVKMNKGRRITDSNTLDIAVMTYAGLINKNIVSILQKFNCNAIGLCGADANLITSKIREIKEIDYGLVGDIISINDNFINQLLKLKISPIICSLTHNGYGQLLNTNADSIASEISIKLSKNYDVTLKYCFDKPGVLIDKNDNLSFKKTISKTDYKQLVNDKIISDGMVPKIENCFYALENGVNNVFIGDHDIIKTTDDCSKIIL